MRKGSCALIVGAAVASMAAGPVLAQKPATAPTPREAVGVDFDGVAPGGLPEGWTVDATSRRGALAVWTVAADATAPSPPNVLQVLPPAHAHGGTFNLCWTSAIPFLDGEIEVKLRANTGREDQGGGPMWRVRDGDNYYVVRYNPLEHNFRLYTVRNGHRHMLTGASRIPIPAGKWLTIRIVQQGDHIQCFLDGKQYIDIHDATFTKPGGVGLWTKSDAATSFDDLVVRPAAR
ncbi:MAG: hypothetical protein GXP47_13220 [Acidobacteria bacterium]|nr:hypothetical protein [Acidobacteriota bacterium]